jgi:uncharacterized protein GlcG (DUF336 family)
VSNLPLMQADQLLRAAEAAALDMGVPMSLAAVDSGGHLVCFRRMEGAPWIGADVAIGKAWTAAAYGVPTREKAKRAQELIHFTNALIAMNRGRYVPQDGGVPVFEAGLLIGGLGASGGTGAQDESALMLALNRDA